MSLRERALVWAVQQHGGQRYGTQPYEAHLRAVMGVVAEYTNSDVALAAAALHDVVEDTDVTVAQVEASFGAEIAEIVAVLTKPPRDATNRLVTYFRGIRRAGSTAVLVKLADRIANVRACRSESNRSERLLEKYRDEFSTFRAQLHQPGEHLALWERLEALLED